MRKQQKQQSFETICCENPRQGVFFTSSSIETIAKLHTILTLNTSHHLGIENHQIHCYCFSVKKGQQILNRFSLLLNDHHEKLTFQLSLTARQPQEKCEIVFNRYFFSMFQNLQKSQIRHFEDKNIFFSKPKLRLFQKEV